MATYLPVISRAIRRAIIIIIMGIIIGTSLAIGWCLTARLFVPCANCEIAK
jgi:hypothetical protein